MTVIGSKCLKMIFVELNFKDCALNCHNRQGFVRLGFDHRRGRPEEHRVIGKEKRRANCACVCDHGYIIWINLITNIFLNIVAYYLTQLQMDHFTAIQIG